MQSERIGPDQAILSDSVFCAGHTNALRCSAVVINFQNNSNMTEFINSDDKRTLLITTAPELETAIRNVLSELLDEREEKSKDARISRKEASRRLGKDVTTLIRWEKAHYITPIYIGKSVYYSEREIIDLEQGRR